MSVHLEGVGDEQDDDDAEQHRPNDGLLHRRVVFGPCFRFAMVSSAFQCFSVLFSAFQCVSVLRLVIGLKVFCSGALIGDWIEGSDWSGLGYLI